MNTHLAYFDETGDDGVVETSSDIFILTSVYMSSSDWQYNYDVISSCRRMLKEKYNFHTSEEMHTKHFLTDKNPYRSYNWSVEDRRNILNIYTAGIVSLKLKAVNVVIDKTKIRNRDSYDVLKNALTYSIQRIENDSEGKWNYIIVSDKGRVAPMRKTARLIRAYNPIPSQLDHSFTNKPIVGMVEDIFEKDSKDSHFIQICDFISYFVNLYYSHYVLGKKLPGRVGALLTEEQVLDLMNYLKEHGVFNLSANKANKYGLVIYPK